MLQLCRKIRRHYTAPSVQDHVFPVTVTGDGTDLLPGAVQVQGHRIPSVRFPKHLKDRRMSIR